MRITYTIFQALQKKKSQDILNTINVVSTIKSLIQKLRDDEWEPLLDIVKTFYEQHEIDVLNMNAYYSKY